MRWASGECFERIDTCVGVGYDASHCVYRAIAHTSCMSVWKSLFASAHSSTFQQMCILFYLKLNRRTHKHGRGFVSRVLEYMLPLHTIFAFFTSRETSKPADNSIKQQYTVPIYINMLGLCQRDHKLQQIIAIDSSHSFSLAYTLDWHLKCAGNNEYDGIAYDCAFVCAFVSAQICITSAQCDWKLFNHFCICIWFHVHSHRLRMNVMCSNKPTQMRLMWSFE